jgi:hypothetical protein
VPLVAGLSPGGGLDRLRWIVTTVFFLSPLQTTLYIRADLISGLTPMTDLEMKFTSNCVQLIFLGYSSRNSSCSTSLLCPTKLSVTHRRPWCCSQCAESVSAYEMTLPMAKQNADPGRSTLIAPNSELRRTVLAHLTLRTVTLQIIEMSHTKKRS